MNNPLVRVATTSAAMDRLVASQQKRDLDFIHRLESYLHSMARAWPKADPVRRQRFAPSYERGQRHRREVLRAISERRIPS